MVFSSGWEFCTEAGVVLEEEVEEVVVCRWGGQGAGSSELLGGRDPDVGARLLLDDELDFVVDLL